jgi:formylglycine-generating enzyme required for sulfatase activity
LQKLNTSLKDMLVTDNIIEALGIPDIVPHKTYEPEVVLVPAGTFLMGSEPGKGVSKWDEVPPGQREIYLPDYYIGKYPVMNWQYEVFVRKFNEEQTEKKIAPPIEWDGFSPPHQKLHHPVTGVTWFEALEYCKWLSKKAKQQRQYSLPSEAQWEKAARGTDGRLYPWGNEWDSTRCNHGSETSTPVKATPNFEQPYFPNGASPYGCYDMSGNVREWTSTRWGVKPIRPDQEYLYPWVADDGREDLTGTEFMLRVHRGGASTDTIEQLRCSARYGFAPNKPGLPKKRHGFRVVMKEA